jgi:Tol biopolymer transport system component
VKPVSEEPRSATIRLGTLAYLNKGDIYIRELPDGPVRRLTSDDKNTSPRWSSNGQWLSFFADSQLCVVHRDGAKRRTFRLVSNWQQNYDWLPGSESLLLVQDAGETIVRADVNSGNVQPLVRCSADYERLVGVSVSPDGKRFVYVVEQHATASNPRR